MKLRKTLIFFVLLFASVFFANVNSSKAFGTCTKPTDCSSGQICQNGTCIATNHTIAPNAPVVGGSGQSMDDSVKGTQGPKSEIVKCGRSGGRMCTLCDLIKGMNYVIQYLMKIAIGIGLLAITIGGVMYVVSAGDKGLVEQAKGTMRNAGIGFVIIFAGWLIINTTINYLGTLPDMGIGVTGWGQFNCDANLGNK